MTETTIQYLSFFAVMLLATYVLFAFARPKEQRAHKPLLHDPALHNLRHETSEEVSPLVTDSGLPYYRDNRLVAMAKDPNSLYTYWDLDQHLSQTLQQHRPSLRVMSTSGLPGQDALIGYFHITGLANNWYLDVPFADTTYYIELGFFDEHGSFTPLLRSNVVTTPAMDFSEIDPNWPPLDSVYKHMNFSFRDVGISSKR